MRGGDRTEQSLVERLLQYDEEAWTQAFATHRDGVFRFCLQMLRNRDEADDISQDTFVRAVQSFEQFRGDASLKTWLYTIARNLCLTCLHDKHKKKGIEVPSDGSRIGKICSEEPCAYRAAASVELLEAFERAMAELDPSLREAFHLREIEDLSYEEIAEVTGVSVNTVKTRIYRARARLQQCLREFR